MSRLGVRGRVVVASALALAVGLGALTATVNLLLAQRMRADIGRVLAARADAQLATLDPGGGRVWVRETPRDAPLDQHAWVFAGSRTLERPPAPAAVDAIARALAGVTRSTRRPAPSDTELLAVPARGAGGGPRLGTVVVGVSTVPYEHTQHLALAACLVLDLFALIVGALVARRAVGAALRPVDQMAHQAADWSEHDLDRRFDLGPPRDELTGLAATLDELLGRVAASRRHEQRFSAEMAHELRTPLSGIRGEAELALLATRTPAQQRRSLQAIVRNIDRMAGVIETLMAVARRETGQGDESADPVAAARRALQALEPAASERSVALEVVAPGRPLRVGVEADVVTQALAPLLDNAVRHASRGVHVRFARTDGVVVVQVEDDGPGVAPTDLDRIFEPGARGTGADGDGAGLGLALARRLARTCGGDVAAVAGPAGGRFVLRLPAVEGRRSGSDQAP